MGAMADDEKLPMPLLLGDGTGPEAGTVVIGYVSLEHEGAEIGSEPRTGFAIESEPFSAQ
jgi:hypothetical protein